MNLIINNSSMVPIYEQIVNGIRDGISKGELKENEALPSVRTLAARLRISSLTVKKAYDRLEEQGLVATIHGKGTYVRGFDPRLEDEARKAAAEEELRQAVNKARNAGLTGSEIKQMIELFTED